MEPIDFPLSSQDRSARAAGGGRRSTPDNEQRARQERLLDEGLEETFPASDPVAVVRLT